MLENEKIPEKKAKFPPQSDMPAAEIQPFDIVKVPSQEEIKYRGVINEGALQELDKEKKRKKKEDPPDPIGILE